MQCQCCCFAHAWRPRADALPVCVVHSSLDVGDGLGSVCFWLLLQRAAAPQQWLLMHEASDLAEPQPRMFRTHAKAVAAALQMLGRKSTNTAVDALCAGAAVVTAEGEEQPLRGCWASLARLPCRPPPPSLRGQTSGCDSAPNARAAPPPPPPSSSARLKRPLAPPLALPPPRSPPRALPARASARSPARAENAIVLPAGREALEACQRILADFSEWDEDVISELLRWGATPRLLSVDDCDRSGRYTRLSCTFVQPDGARVQNIRLPLTALMANYPSRVQSFLQTSTSRTARK